MKLAAFDLHPLGDVHTRRPGTAFALHRCALYLLIAATVINLMLA